MQRVSTFRLSHAYWQELDFVSIDCKNAYPHLLGWKIGKEGLVKTPLLRLIQQVPKAVFDSIVSDQLKDYFESVEDAFEDKGMIHLLVKASAPAPVTMLYDLCEKRLARQVTEMKQKVLEFKEVKSHKITPVLSRELADGAVVIKFCLQ